MSGADRQIFQKFWRCAHHPVSTENFFSKRTNCEFDCHVTELRWYHNGTHPQPKSWSRTPPGSLEWSELQRTGL